MNPIVNQMMNMALSNNPIMKMYQQVRTAKDPNTMLQQLAQSNPQLQQTLDFISQNGGNAKQLFFNASKQRNVDPNTIINSLNTQR